MSSNVQGVFVDLDGTVYRGREAIPGAADFVRRLEEQEVPYLYVTNRSSRTPETICRQLEDTGIPCHRTKIVTSAQAAAAWIGKGRVFFVGEEGLEQALLNQGMTITEERPDYVVVGFDQRVDYAKIATASRLIRAGARFIATNPDKTLNTEQGVVPGAGAIVAAVAAASGHEPTVIGKPGPILFEIALRLLDLAAGDAVAVGDNLETDIRGGIRAGLRTALVLTGISSREDLDASPLEPDWVAADLFELGEIFFGPRSSDG